MSVLDAGSGPGRYTIDLARRGYSVTLLDPSPQVLRLARERVAAAGNMVSARVMGMVEGSITALPTSTDRTFDAVLCVGGVLSHLLDARERLAALLELRRVAKPGAPIVISVLNHLASYRAAVLWPGLWDTWDPAFLGDTRTAPIANGALVYEFWPRNSPPCSLKQD